MVAGILLLVVLIKVSPPLWRNLVTYPRIQRQVSEFQKLRKEPPSVSHLKVYRGVLHGHSYWSHDSEGTLHELVSAAKKTGTNFIFLSDHPHGNRDTFPRGIRGMFDGVLIEPGSEKKGLNAWPFDTTVVDWSQETDTIISQLVKNGGLVLYSHPEEPHPWNNPWFHGMEIYNFHVDTEDESLLPVILNFTINNKRYKHWAYREIFDEQKSFLAHWDSLNLKRRVVGFAAIDAHENQNYRAKYLKDGRVQWWGPNAKIVDTMEVRWWNKWLFHKPDEDGWIFKWMIDTYETGFDYVTNYVLADSLTVPSIADNVKKGHLYAAFKSLGDAKGFLFYSVNQKDSITAIPGDSVSIGQVKALKAISPYPGQYRLIHNGKVLEVSSKDDYSYSWSNPMERGTYRIEIHLKYDGNYVPWLYSNPVYVY